MVVLTALAKLFSAKIFLQYKGSWAWRNFYAAEIFMHMVYYDGNNIVIMQ